MKRFLLLIGIITVIGLVACDDAGEAESVEKGEAEDEEKEDEELDEEFGIGETVELGDYHVTVTNVETDEGDEFEQPAEGKDFILVSVKIENNGDEDIDYNPYDFELENSNGQKEEIDLIAVRQDEQLQSGKLSPGGEVEGIVPFEEDIEDDLKLHFTPNFLSDKKITFDIND